MSDSADLLGLSATRSRLHALTGAQVLDARELERGLVELELRPSKASWSRYLYWHALILGVVLFVAGTIFFVAANWSSLPGVARMGIVGGLLAIATMVGGYLGDSLTGRAVSLLGGLLFGPLLAVYGQVYQTGADAWQLFAMWALVLLAYAVLVRFVGTWVIALIITHVAWFSWIAQELGGDLYEGDNAWLVASLALLDAAVVVIAERWLDGREREVLVHTAGSLGLAVALPFGVIALADGLPEGGAVGLLVLLGGLAAIWLIYRWKRPRLGMLVALATVVSILVAVFVGRILLDVLDAELFGVALLGAVVCGEVWGFTRWLLSWRREHPVAPTPTPTPIEQRSERAEPRRRITLRELFASIGARPADPSRIAEALHDGDATDGPVLVRVFTAIGTWIGATMVAVIFAALEIYEVVPLAVILGAALFVGAFVLARRPRRSLAITQLIWAMALGAHGLWLGAALELDVGDVTVAAIWTLLNIAALLLIRTPSFALGSAIAAVGFATWLATTLELPLYPLWVALPIAAVATATWIFEVPWAARLGRTWSALAYGLPLGVAGPLTLLSLDGEGQAMVARGSGATIATLIVVALIGVVLWRAQREQGAIETRAHAVGVIAVLCVLAARHVPGVSLALLWLLLAHLRKSAGLQIIALVQLAGFLFFFYYQLETTLLLKSLWVLSTAVVLLLGAWLGRVRTRSAEQAPVDEQRRSRWLPAIALTLLSTGLVAGASIHKQQILAHGQTVLLPLAPVDPRSLMQGDYMVLRYALEEELPRVEIPRHGRLVIRVDDDGVGHFVRIDDDRELGERELRIEYRLREGWNGRLRIGAESFLFEEGVARIYEDARFGELIVADDGEVVLIGLRDADRLALGPRMH